MSDEFICVDLELNDIKSWMRQRMLQPSLFQPLHQIENRVESSDPSALSPPADAPDWALIPEY